jgi:large subunit ribosomal protein L25
MPISLQAATRTKLGRKTNFLRAANTIPAVVYGDFIEPQTIEVDHMTFVKTYNAAGESSIVDLAIDAEKSLPVLIHDYQTNPLTDEVTHIDFRAVDLTKPIDAVVRLKFVGESAAVKALGGTLILSRDSVTINCLPTNLMRNIIVDLGQLATFEDVIRVGDLNVNAGVTLLDSENLTVAIVAKPRTAAEMAALDEDISEDVAAVEGGEEKAEGEEGEEGKPGEADSGSAGDEKDGESKSE